jgi:GNAT superfamily N-acetyltransferase
MDGVLQDFSTAALVTAVEANQLAYSLYLARSPRVELHEEPGLTWFSSGIPLSFMNGVLQTRLDADEADGRIEDIQDIFRSRGLPFNWLIGSATRPPDLVKRLEAHGLSCTHSQPGMAADLLALNEESRAPAGLTIRPVTDDKGLTEWVHTTFAGFGFPTSLERAFSDVLAGLGFDLPARNYVGLLDGRPVATSTLFLAAGTAGVYWVSTIPEARRRGIGTALTLAPLREARAMGYRVGILHASETGMGSYTQIGFRAICTMCRCIKMDRASPASR